MQTPIAVKDFEDILAVCNDKAIVKISNRLWLLSVDETGGIAKLPIKPYGSVISDPF